MFTNSQLKHKTISQPLGLGTRGQIKHRPQRLHMTIEDLRSSNHNSFDVQNTSSHSSAPRFTSTRTSATWLLGRTRDELRGDRVGHVGFLERGRNGNAQVRSSMCGIDATIDPCLTQTQVGSDVPRSSAPPSTWFRRTHPFFFLGPSSAPPRHAWHQMLPGLRLSTRSSA